MTKWNPVRSYSKSCRIHLNGFRDLNSSRQPSWTVLLMAKDIMIVFFLFVLKLRCGISNSGNGPKRTHLNSIYYWLSKFEFLWTAILTNNFFGNIKNHKENPVGIILSINSGLQGYNSEFYKIFKTALGFSCIIFGLLLKLEFICTRTLAIVF